MCSHHAYTPDLASESYTVALSTLPTCLRPRSERDFVLLLSCRWEPEANILDEALLAEFEAAERLAAGETSLTPPWLVVGAPVQARFEARRYGRRAKKWYSGCITAVYPDDHGGSCDVSYDDGDFEARVLYRHVRRAAHATAEPSAVTEHSAGTELLEPADVRNDVILEGCAVPADGEEQPRTMATVDGGGSMAAPPIVLAASHTAVAATAVQADDNSDNGNVPPAAQHVTASFAKAVSATASEDDACNAIHPQNGRARFRIRRRNSDAERTPSRTGAHCSSYGAGEIAGESAQARLQAKVQARAEAFSQAQAQEAARSEAQRRASIQAAAAAAATAARQAHQAAEVARTSAHEREVAAFEERVTLARRECEACETKLRAVLDSDRT